VRLVIGVQTFSHFTWEASKHNLVVVDIQVSTPPAYPDLDVLSDPETSAEFLWV